MSDTEKVETKQIPLAPCAVKRARVIAAFIGLALTSGCVTSDAVQQPKVPLTSAISELIGVERSKQNVLKLTSQKDIFCHSVKTFRVTRNADALDVFDGVVFPDISRRIENTEKVYEAYAEARTLTVCSKTSYTADGSRFYDFANLLFDKEDYLLLIDNRIRKD